MALSERILLVVVIIITELIKPQIVGTIWW
jgi:hypothetical protein